MEPTPVDDHWLEQQLERQLAFARRFPRPGGGAWWLGSDGEPLPEHGVHTWITARMAHVYCLGALLGIDGAGELADRALDGLRGPLHDEDHGGWFAQVAADGGVVDDTKAAYAHAFVLLAASSAVVAERPGAAMLLARARSALDDHFWDPELRMYVDHLDRSFTVLDPYRGVNANMHAVEAELAYADAVDDPAARERALAITTRVLDEAAGHDWRIPEHFTPAWEPLLEHHADEPDHPFEPYGATVGHAFEWARLAVQLEAALGDAAPSSLRPGAVELFDRAVGDGWSADGASGFVYTTDWSGRPVVRERMHWVLAEAIMSASALGTATADPAYEHWYTRWWEEARQYFVDPVTGSWQHQLDPDNEPSESVWVGRPDVYHSGQAVLLPRLPLSPTAAHALSDAPPRTV